MRNGVCECARCQRIFNKGKETGRRLEQKATLRDIKAVVELGSMLWDVELCRRLRARDTKPAKRKGKP
jgi:hypothetical protein